MDLNNKSPGSFIILNTFAWHACQAGDKATAKAVFTLIEDKYNPLLWKNRMIYAKWRKWAESSSERDKETALLSALKTGSEQAHAVQSAPAISSITSEGYGESALNTGLEEARATTPGLAISSKTCEDYIESANRAYLAGDYKQAISQYDEAIALVPVGDERSISMHEGKGRSLMWQGNYALAENDYQVAIKNAAALKVNNTAVLNAYLGLAYCLDKEGRLKQAKTNYKIAWRMTKNPRTKRKIENILRNIQVPQQNTQKGEDQI